MSIHQSRDNFFAGPALAADEHRRARVGNLLDGLLYFFHLRAGAKERGKVALLAHLFANLRYLAADALLVEHALDAHLEVFGLEGLIDIVVGASLRCAE